MLDPCQSNSDKCWGKSMSLIESAMKKDIPE